MTALAPTMQAFFTDRLALQRQASGHTIAAYRDALRTLAVYASQQAGKSPSRLDIADLDAQTAGAFPSHLENKRGNSARTRNARLAAIHSLFQYAAVRHPEHAADIARVPAIPPKRFDKALITYLTEDEITALLAAPDLTTWTGRRDQALLVLACQTPLFITRRGTAHRQIHRDRRDDMPLAAGEEGIAPRHAAFRRHETPQRRRRYLGHRALDGSREHCHNSGLHPRRPGAQGTGDRPDRSPEHCARTLPAARRHPGVPRRPVIMPNAPRRRRGPPTAPAAWSA